MSNLLIDKAWEILEKEGLKGLAPERLAFYCHLPLHQVSDIYPTPLSILLGLWTFIENNAHLSDPLPELPQDCLFEQLMSILDVLEPYQNSIKRLIEELTFAPCWIKDLSPYALKWAHHALDKAHIPLNSLYGSIKTYSFAAFSFYILKIWSTDDSPDKSLTMVKLDQGLVKLFDWILK